MLTNYNTMRIYNPNLTLEFVSAGPQGQPRTTSSIVLDSINITKQLYNELHSSSNSCSLQLKYDGTTLIEDIIKDNADIRASLADGNTPLFTGILSNEHSWRVSNSGEEVFQIKIEDTGTRYLNKPFVEDDGTCIRDTLQNIILSIGVKCGSVFSTTFDSSVSSTLKNKILVRKLSSSITCKEILDTICYEFGLVYFFNESGNLVIKKMADLTSSPSTTIASTGNFPHFLYTKDRAGVDLTRKSRQYSQAKVKFSTISDSTNIVPIYAVTETIEVPATEWWDGATHTDNIYEYTLDEFFLADKDYYTFNGTTYVQATIYPSTDPDPTHTPKVGDAIPDNTYYEYAGQASLVDMIDSTNGKEILYVYPNTIVPNLEGQTGEYPGYVSVVEEAAHPSKWTIKQHKNTTKLEILIDNTQGGTTSFYNKFSAAGRIIRIQGTSNIYRSLVGLTSNSEVQFNYEAEWIHDRDDAIALCETLSNYYLYCDNTYTFYCVDDIDLGSVVRVYENLYSGLDVNMLLIAKQYVGNGNQAGLYKYTAQGISAFDLNATTRAEKYEMPSTSNVSLVDTEVMYAVDSQGTDPSQVPSAAWQTAIPTGTAGDWLWTRTQYIYSNGNTYYEYSVSYVASGNFEFRLEVMPSNLIANRRRTDTQEIHITTSIDGYAGTPTLKYWYGDADPDDPYIITAASATIFLPYNHNHSSLVVTAELSGAPTQRTEILTIDETEEYIYYGELGIDTSDYFDVDGQLVPANYNLIDWSSINMMLGTNEQFIEGDSFFNNYTETGFTDVYIYVYQGSQWIPIQFSNLSNSLKSAICMKAQKNVLSTIEAGTVTKSDFGYFNTIIAGTVTADYIGGKEIEIHDGGFIYAGDVDISQPAGQRVGQTGAGFCFDSLGNAELANIRITGDSTIEGGSTVLGTLINYDANGDPVFRTVKETNTRVSMTGSKVDGTNAPNAYLWKDFYNYFTNQITSNLTDGTAYDASGTIRGTWSSSVAGKTIRAVKYYATAPDTAFSQDSQYGMINGITGDLNSNQVETKTIWTNTGKNTVHFDHVTAYPKTESGPFGTQTQAGSFSIDVCNSGGSIRQTFIDAGTQGPSASTGGFERTASNIDVPPGGFIQARWGTWGWSRRGSHGWVKLYYRDSDNFTQGINLIVSNGDTYNADNVIPNTSSYSTNAQSLSITGTSVSFDIEMTASSSWPFKKYYRFSYTQSPGVSTTVTTSIFYSQSFTYEGVSKTVASITFNNSMLKIIDTNGQAYEFYTSSGYYYPQHTFSIITLGEELGAYMRSVLPTDDSLNHNVGASTTYSSGNPQRWNTGFFTSLDVSQGIHAQTINAAWNIPIITTTSYTITDDFVVGTMRPYLTRASGRTTFTMPGDSSQSYLMVTLNVLGAVAIAVGQTPYYYTVAGGATQQTPAGNDTMIVFVIRLS